MDKKKLILFITISFVIPLVYILLRFNLFTSQYAISLWGLILIVFVVVFGGVMIKYYIDGMKTRYSLLKQILSGVIKVIIPLVCVLAVAVFFLLKSQWFIENTKLFIEALSVLIACEIIGIIINPFPKWMFDNNIEGLQEITDKVLKKRDEEK